MTLMLARRGRVVFRCLRLVGSHKPGDRLAHAPGSVLGAARNLGTSTRSTFVVRSLPTTLRNSYATAAGRPKAHTGRAKAAKKTPSTSKAKSKAKKAGVKKAKAKKSKAKAPTKKRKGLTDKQKEEKAKKERREKIKALKETALTPPKRLPANAWAIVCQENGGQISGNMEAYKNLPAAERERLDKVAEANRNSNKSAMEHWVKSHTPLQIKQANDARRRLRQLLKQKTVSFAPISDGRLVKRPRNGYIFFIEEHLASGVASGTSVQERATEAGRLWKNMSSAEQGKYHQKAEDDLKRYVREYTSVYGEEPPKPSRRVKVKA